MQRQVIPADKKLEPAWVRSLYERGRKQIYANPKALEHIGMPVGGLFAGTVYLSGDGRLWLWDIFNRDQEGILPRNVSYKGATVGTRYGFNYVEPAPVVSPFKQGFALQIGDKTRSLDMKGFSDITFDGRYPIGRVTYRDPDCPVKVVLDAFSPFISLNVDDSPLPATVMRYTITNTSSQRVNAELVGHLQNTVCQDTGDKVVGRRRNRVVREAMLTAIECLAEPGDADNAVSRPDIVFENFEKPTYAGWTVEGTAFRPFAR